MAKKKSPSSSRGSAAAGKKNVPAPSFSGHPIARWCLAHPALTGVLCGALTAASFAGLSLFFLAWVSVAGVLMVVLSAPSPRRAAWCAFCYGVVLSLLNHHWMLFVRMPAPVGYVIAAPAVGAYFALWAWLVVRVGRRHPVALVLLYLFLEQWVNIGPLQFGWYTLGYTQWNNPVVLQAARLVGGHGLSALLLMVNTGVALWLLRGRRKPLALGVSATLALSALGVAAGVAGKKNLPAEVREPLQMVMVQVNVSGEVKEGATPAENREIFWNHLRRAEEKNPRPGALVVFPETFVSAYLEDDPAYRDLWLGLVQFVTRHRVWLAFGMNDYVQTPRGWRDTNGFMLMNPQAQVVARYHKRSLVPFGEFVPGRAYFEKLGLGDAIRNNIIYQDNLPGEEATVFTGPGGRRFSSPICFETAFPWQFRQYVQGGAHFVLTPTNDAWYGKSFLAVQRLAQGVMRSVESGLPVVQSSNSGIGYMADPWGGVKWRTGVMEMAVIKANLTLSARMTPIDTPYGRFGAIWEWLIWITTPVSLLLLGKPWLKSNHEDTPTGPASSF